jgi:hypothetical protein
MRIVPYPIALIVKIYGDVSTGTCLVRNELWKKERRLSILNTPPTQSQSCRTIGRLETKYFF